MAAVVTVLVAASNAATAGAQADTEEPVDVAVASYASDYNVTHQEAQRRLDRIQPLQQILASIRSLETDRLAGWGIDHTGAFTGWVWLTGDQPASAAVARIANAHTDVEFRTGATHTLTELLDAQTGLFRIGATGHVTGGPDTTAEIKRIVTYTSIDMRANAVEMGIDPALASTVPGGLMDPDPVAVTDETLQTKITEVTQQLQDHIDVAYVVKDGRGVSSEESFSGGQSMTRTLGSLTRRCTSGFAAQEDGTGVYGIITAGHCGSWGPSEIWTFSMHGVELPHDYGWFSSRADAQFHTIPTGSGHVLNDDYLCHDSWPMNYCDVTGDEVRSEMMGEYLCHAGRSSGVLRNGNCNQLPAERLPK